MRFFKSKILRRIITIILTITLVILIDSGMNVLLSPVTYANYFNYEADRIAESGKEVDIVFCGASRTHRTFAPSVFQEKLGLGCVINAATAGQPMRATYYAAKEMIERFHPKQMFIGVVWNGLSGGQGLQGRLVVYDRLSQKNKLLMVADTFDSSEYPYVSAMYRFRDNLNPKKMQRNLNRKIELANTNYADSEEDPEGHDNGFVYRSGSIPTGNVKIDVNGAGFNPEKIKPENLGYLDAIVEMCQKNGIKVTLVSGITSVMRMYALKNYQGAVDYYAAYAKEKGLVYYNLNYLMDRESFLPDEFMGDSNHVNGDGALLVSAKLAEVMAMEARGEDTSGCFYANLDEFKKTVHRIVAVKASIDKNPDDPAIRHFKVFSLQNEDVEPVYRVSFRRTEDEEYTVIRDWAPETEFDIRVEEEPGYTLKVEAGSSDGTYGLAYQEYKQKN